MEELVKHPKLQQEVHYLKLRRKVKNSMAVYGLSYDLNKEGANYNKAKEKLEERLKAYTRIKPMRSYWLLSSNKTTSQIYEHIKDCFDSNDNFIISKITADCYGQLRENSCEFIAKHS